MCRQPCLRQLGLLGIHFFEVNVAQANLFGGDDRQCAMVKLVGCEEPKGEVKAHDGPEMKGRVLGRYDLV